jgi:GT2 family glycosyltransferase
MISARAHSAADDGAACEPLSIAVLVTCFNRIATTLRGLDLLFRSAANLERAALDVFLIDDASPDGTGAAVTEHFPQVHVTTGTGSLFWNRGMCRAYAQAQASGKAFDAYLLFNDDVELVPDALERAVAAFVDLNRDGPAVVVGAMASHDTHEFTYAGFDLVSKYRALGLARVLPGETARRCDTFNGNFVLIPAKEMDACGGLDPAYHHSYGDIDLGLTLGQRGCRSFVLPGYLGYCDYAPVSKPPSFARRVRGLFYPPLPLSDQIHLAYKRFSWPYATLVVLIQIVRRFSDAVVPWLNR